MPIRRPAGKLAGMSRKHDPRSWALWSFVAGFPVGWLVEGFLSGDSYGLFGGIIGGLIAMPLGINEAKALNERQSQSQGDGQAADQPPGLN
jgi:F0F1-type ATP synthase assembly protein I